MQEASCAHARCRLVSGGREGEVETEGLRGGEIVTQTDGERDRERQEEEERQRETQGESRGGTQIERQS